MATRRHDIESAPETQEVEVAQVEVTHVEAVHVQLANIEEAEAFIQNVLDGVDTEAYVVRLYDGAVVQCEIEMLPDMAVGKPSYEWYHESGSYHVVGYDAATRTLEYRRIEPSE